MKSVTTEIWGNDRLLMSSTMTGAMSWNMLQNALCDKTLSCRHFIVVYCGEECYTPRILEVIPNLNNCFRVELLVYTVYLRIDT